MWNAVITKYVGPTNTKGARIVASNVDGRRVSIPYPHELSGEACHRAALDALILKWGLTVNGNWVGGAIKGGYAFVRTK